MANGHGGKRAGSGRRKGAAEKRSRAIAEKVAADGNLTPLQYVIDVMRNPKTTRRRKDWAASTALPYVHPRLQSIAGDPDKPIVHEHRISMNDATRRIAFVLYTTQLEAEKGVTIDQAPEPKKALA